MKDWKAQVNKMPYYWVCTANPKHVSADYRCIFMFHWNKKFCVQCSAPMIDIRPREYYDHILAKAERRFQ